jgi:hypothetical protein
MKMQVLSAALAAALLQAPGCGDEARLEAIEFPLDHSFTTEQPIDPGIVHNEILAEMDAASTPAGTLTSAEYLNRVAAAANRAFARYGASRKLTVDDCKSVLGIGSAIQPLYDFRFSDPSRADPVRVLQYWYDHGLLSHDEFVQLQPLFAVTTAEKGSTVAATIAVQPASEVVAAGVSVYQASMSYWGALSIDGKGRVVQQGGYDELRKGWGDALGGIIGSILGGTIGGAIVGMGTSTLFIIQEECWPGPCYGDPPPPAPCGGYRGIGPCPD